MKSLKLINSNYLENIWYFSLENVLISNTKLFKLNCFVYAIIALTTKLCIFFKSNILFIFVTLVLVENKLSRTFKL